MIWFDLISVYVSESIIDSKNTQKVNAEKKLFQLLAWRLTVGEIIHCNVSD